MKLRPGCGCPLFIVAIIDLVFVVSCIIGIVSGPSSTPATSTTLGLSMTLFIMLANMIACILLAMAAFRQRRLEQSVSETSALEDSPQEGEDAGSGEDEEGA
jgi:hypothetical protein